MSANQPSYVLTDMIVSEQSSLSQRDHSDWPSWMWESEATKNNSYN